MWNFETTGAVQIAPWHGLRGDFPRSAQVPRTDRPGEGKAESDEGDEKILKGSQDASSRSNMSIITVSILCQYDLMNPNLRPTDHYMSLAFEMLSVSICVLICAMRCRSHLLYLFHFVSSVNSGSCQRLLGDQPVDPQLQLLLRSSQQLRRTGGLHQNTATTQKCHGEGHGEWRRMAQARGVKMSRGPRAM